MSGQGRCEATTIHAVNLITSSLMQNCMVAPERLGAKCHRSVCIIIPERFAAIRSRIPFYWAFTEQLQELPPEMMAAYNIHNRIR
ncbi:unnamed protein product [Gongylonema pulchrum]|uniref:Uncharacterized protein n=1 Tax=Gongylonema pulchrum TaxID=637853 RepID=A0A183EAD6_9BILA|nr:unnamed protein product [Gongylonema pulchrum]